MGYVPPPPRRLRYRTNLFVIWVWYKEMMTYCCVTMYLEVPCQWLCPVKVEIPKYNCYNHFYVNNVDSLQLFFRVWRRMQLWCGRNVLLTPISTWTRLEVRTTTTSGWAQNFRVGRSVATERIVFRSRILSEYSIHVPLEGQFVRLSHDRVSCVWVRGALVEMVQIVGTIC